MSKRFKKHNPYHSRTIWYVTIYNKYPIYESAEGGYYYSGCENSISFVFNKLKKAKEFYEKNYDKYVETSKYIGEGTFMKIETKIGKYNSGKQIYC